jgi:hypothetical protein
MSTNKRPCISFAVLILIITPTIFTDDLDGLETGQLRARVVDASAARENSQHGSDFEKLVLWMFRR